MLHLLSGRQHRVLTGVCLMHTFAALPPNPRAIRRDLRIASTVVKFAAMSEKEIDDYVATGEPMDKAGAYGIQGRASKFAERIDGCYFNIVGLPVSLVYEMLRAMESVLSGKV